MRSSKYHYMLTCLILFGIFKHSLANNFLLFTNSLLRDIFKMDLETKSYLTIPISNHKNPIAIDYDPVQAKIYWTDVVSKQIRSAGIDGSEDKVIRQLNVVSIPDGIAVDVINRLIIYTDTGHDIIAVMTLDGSIHHRVIDTGLDQPRALALNMNKGVMYWTDWGSRANIMSANYDGSNKKTLINTGLQYPNGLTIDIPNNKMYWCDAGTMKIEMSTLDGRNRRTVLQLGTDSHLFGLDYNNDILYFTDWKNPSVMQISTSGENTTLKSVGPHVFGSRLNDIHCYGNATRQVGSTGCTKLNGGCSSICVPNGVTGSLCLCPDGVTCGDGPDNIVLSPNSIEPVLEGEDMSSVICSADCKPSCDIKWYKGYVSSGNLVSSHDGVLNLTNMDKLQAGNYLCVAKNINNNNQKIKQIDISVLSIPDPPRSVTLKINHHDDICVYWKSDIDGGEPQIFIVQHSTDNNTWIDSSPLSYSKDGNSSHYCIAHLKTDTLYYIRIHAENKYGSSPAVIMQQRTFKKPETVVKEDQVNSNDMMGVGAGVGIGIGVCVLLVVLVLGSYCIYRKRKYDAMQSNETYCNLGRTDESPYEELNIMNLVNKNKA